MLVTMTQVYNRLDLGMTREVHQLGRKRKVQRVMELREWYGCGILLAKKLEHLMTELNCEIDDERIRTERWKPTHTLTTLR